MGFVVGVIAGSFGIDKAKDRRDDSLSIGHTN